MNPRTLAKEWYELLARTEAKDWQSVHLYMLKKVRALGKLSQLSFVLKILRSTLYANAGMVSAVVRSARTIDAHGFASKVFLGKKVEVTAKEDTSLVAGAVLETDEMRVDASLKGQLLALEQFMINND